jgi:DnaK suppressor protein
VEGDRARRLLEAERERLVGLQTQAQAQLADSQQEGSSELSSLDQHPGEAGTDTLEREQAQSVAEHVKESLAEVDAALQRVEEGTYGSCTVCGADIGTARLEARPQARLCLEHQTADERQARGRSL